MTDIISRLKEIGIENLLIYPDIHVRNESKDAYVILSCKQFSQYESAKVDELEKENARLKEKLEIAKALLKKCSEVIHTSHREDCCYHTSEEDECDCGSYDILEEINNIVKIGEPRE